MATQAFPNKQTRGRTGRQLASRPDRVMVATNGNTADGRTPPPERSHTVASTDTAAPVVSTDNKLTAASVKPDAGKPDVQPALNGHVATESNGRVEGTTAPRVATKANGRTQDLLKLAMSSEGAARGGYLRDWLALDGNTVKQAAAALSVSTTRINALVNGPTVKARYALRVNPEAVFKGMTADELDTLRSILDDMGAGEQA